MRQFYYQTHFGSATMWATPDAPSPESPRARGSQGGLMKNRVKGLVVAALLIGMSGLARAAEAPAEIKLGTLYASSGRYASISMPVHSGLKLWIEQKNAEGGVFVKAFDKKIPVKLVAYDDQSNTGTGASFFSPENPYIVLMADPVSTIWPKPLADFITQDGPKLGIEKVALIYATNEFTGTQANAVRKFIKESGSGVELVYDNGVPTETSNYTVLINNIRASNPDAVVHLGYAPNDIAFLRNLQDSGVKFKMLFCIYPGLETELLEKNVGDKGLNGVYTYVPSSEIAYKADFGMSLPDFKKAWDKKYADGKVEFGFNSVAGYTTGLVLEKALSVTDSLDQMALRKAIFSLSGKLRTLDGTFELDQTGAQIGEITPLGQLVNEGGHIKFVTVFPHDVANGKPLYPAP